MSPINITPKVATRFWSRVKKTDDCWLWTGGTVTGGYGSMYVCPHNCRAHRIAWALTNGSIPDGMNVLHKCDNPPCVNPAHLFIGTHADNIQDKLRKGRGTTGEKNPSAKMSDAKALTILTRLASLPRIGGRVRRGLLPAIAAEFGLSYANIKHLHYGTHWKHLKPLIRHV